MKADRKSEGTPRRKGPLSARPRTGSAPKPAAVSACPDCGASYRNGRWTWTRAPASATRRKCPACRRIHLRDAGGFVTLTGPFLVSHRDEILGLVKSREARQKAEHPLERIIAIEPQGEGLVVSTTEAHLANAIARALRDAFDGKMQINPGERPLRARWHR